jgi:hypothetical protein
MRQYAAFDDSTTSKMGHAFDLACSRFGSHSPPMPVKELIADRILETALSGERDPDRLCEQTLYALGILS